MGIRGRCRRLILPGRRAVLRPDVEDAQILPCPYLPQSSFQRHAATFLLPVRRRHLLTRPWHISRHCLVRTLPCHFVVLAPSLALVPLRPGLYYNWRRLRYPLGPWPCRWDNGAPSAAVPSSAVVDSLLDCIEVVDTEPVVDRARTVDTEPAGKAMKAVGIGAVDTVQTVDTEPAGKVRRVVDIAFVGKVRIADTDPTAYILVGVP